MIRLAAATAAVGTAVHAFRIDDQSAGVFAVLLAIELMLDAYNRGEWSFRRPRVVDGVPGTLGVRRILAVLAADAGGLWVWSISELSGVGAARVMTCMDRLEMAGWARAHWEEPEPLNRPRRRFYRLTERGRVHALDLLGLTEWTDVTS